MTSPFVEPLSKRKRKKGPDDEIIKNVVVLKSSQVREKDGVVLMPKTTLDMSEIKKLGQSRKITFTKSTSSGDLQRKLEEKFPFLKEASGRFYCAKAVENRSKLDFCGDRCVWSGAFINKNITGNSALYIYCEEEKEGDSGHYSSDPDLPGAPVYGNCLVTTAPQGCKRFGSEPCPATEGPIDKETLRAVESQTCGTVRESDRNYRPFGQPEGVKTQVIEIEASACALNVGREAAEEEQIQDQNPNTWLLTLQPTLLLSDLPEQTNRFTLAPLLESLQVCCKDIEIQKPYDQASTETLTAKGSQRAQQNTSVTVGDSDNQESSSEDRNDSGFETCTTPLDTSRNRDSLLSNTNTTGSPEPDEYETNNDFEINEDFKEAYSRYPGAEKLNWPINNPHELPLIDHNLRSEENGQDTLSRNSQNNAEVEETNQDVAQEISHPQVEGDEPNHIFEQEQFDHGSESEETMQDTLSRNFQSNAGVEETSQDVAQEISHPQVEGDEPNHIFEQEQFVRTICPSSSRVEGGGNFQISLKEELPEHIQSGYASFGNELVVLTKFNKLTLAGTIPAAQEPGVVKVRVYSDAGEFLGETNFEYEDILDTVAFQAVQLGPDGLSKLFALMGKHMWNQRSSATQSSSAKQNSGQATGALNDSCQDRSSPVENTVMDDEYEDLVQHFQDFVKWLSEQSFHPIHSNTDTWLKLSNAVDGLCRKLACSEDEENFKGNQQTCSQEREENYFADAENSSCMSSEDDSASLSDPDNWSETFNACTEAEEDLEGDQLTCTQKRDENYFPNTEDYSSVSSETDSALSDSESWDESISDSSLSFSWVNSRSNKSLEAIPETESTQNSYKAVYSKLDVSHEILAPMTEGFTTEDSIGDNTFVGCGVCHKWNTSLPESKESEENCGKDDHNEKQDSSQEWVFYSEEGTSHTLLASHDDTPLHCLDVPTLKVENEESQYQDHELFETLHTNAEPQLSESICSVTSNQQSATHPEPISQEAAQSPLSNPLWNGDSKLNMAPQQCSDEEIHSGQEWEESGEGLASWFNLCENEDTGKNEHSRWEISSMEPSKTDGGVEKDIFDSEEDLSQEQGLISEQGDFHTRLSLPDDTSVQSRGPRVENEESQSIGDISIVEAARNGYTDTVRLLVEKGADVNQSGSMSSKVTKLILAARKGQTDIVWLFLKEAIVQNKTVNWFCEHSPLTAAARNGHTDIVRLLIENRADVNKGEWSIGDISIVGAARNDYTDTVHLLVKKGADVNQSGSMGLPLTEAVKNGHTNIVRLLIENGADVNKGGLDTPLTEAATNGHAFIVRLLIENGADVNKGGLDTPLTAAVRNGHTDIVRLLIQNGADVNQVGLETPLTEAVANSHTDIVRLLIKNGANVNQGGLNLKHNPLAAAISYGHTDIVRLLIENGANVNHGGLNLKHNPLAAAISYGHTDIVRLLIENGADVDQEGGDTSLNVAVKNGHTDIVRLLIENGADGNKGGGILEHTLLTKAVRRGDTDIVRWLIKNGAKAVNSKGGNLKSTPLTAAVSYGHTDIVRLIIENGADVNNEEGNLKYTPLTTTILLIEAVWKGHTDIVRLLIENGADVTQGGGILLTEAVWKGHTDIVRLLIENGADVTQGGGILLSEAVRKGHTDIVKLFIEIGADFNQGGGFLEDILLIEGASIGDTFFERFSPLQFDLLSFRQDIPVNLADLLQLFYCLRFIPTMELFRFQGTKVLFERELDVQLKGKKTASLPRKPGKRLKTQTEMTSPRDIVQEGKCGKDSTTDVELGLNCLHLSPKCEQFKPFAVVESPGDSSIMHHDFKPINKHMDRVTLTDVGKAKQGHCVVVKIAKTHPSGDTIVMYGRKINEGGSSVGEAFQLATKDLKDTWEDEEMIAENVQIGSVVKYVQAGDEFLFQGNTKRPRWDMDRIFLDLSCTDGAHRGTGDAFLSFKLLTEDSYQDCTPKETSCFSSLKCGVVENDRISVITKLWELLNLRLNCREDFIPRLSPSTLELILVEVNKDVVDGAVVEMREPLLISGVDGFSKLSYPVLGEGLNLRDEPKETSVEAEKPEAEEKDDEDGNAF